MAGVGVVVVLAVGGPFVYIHFIEGPAPAKFAADPTGSVGAALTTGQVDGKWTIGTGSQAGYRVQETLAGQHATAVGRGTGVTGGLTIAGTSVTKASFTVDLRTVKSDRSQRDDQFNGRIMNTAEFPNATFALTQPIALGSIPKVNQTITVMATGNLTMHGVTKPVSFSMQAFDSGSTLQITGEIPIAFVNWNIANPSFGGFVKTGNDGTVEFKLLAKKS